MRRSVYVTSISQFLAISGNSDLDVLKIEVDAIRSFVIFYEMHVQTFQKKLALTIRHLKEYWRGSVRSEKFLLPMIFPSCEAVLEPAVHGGSK